MAVPQDIRRAIGGGGTPMIRHGRHGETRLNTYHVSIVFLDGYGRATTDSDYVSAPNEYSARLIALRPFRPHHNAQVVLVEKVEF